MFFSFNSENIQFFIIKTNSLFILQSSENYSPFSLKKKKKKERVKTNRSHIEKNLAMSVTEY